MSLPLKILAFLAVINCGFALPAFLMGSQKPKPKIVIIGAGASGIAAGVKLLEYGYTNLTILEAAARIGGRIHTIPYGENVIDLGAQWCHGEAGNIVYDLAYPQGLLEHANASNTNISYIRSNGEILKKELQEKLVKLTEDIVEEGEQELPNYNGTVGEYLRYKFFAKLNTAAYKNVDKTIATEFYNAYEKETSINEAADNLDVISARDYYKFQGLAGDNALNWKDKGYKEFLHLLMKTHEVGKEFGILQEYLKLSKNVVKIDWQRLDGNKVLIECADGEKIEADHVIVTASLGVLKAKLNEMFTPQLPVEKQNVINALQFGAFNKIFLEFPANFWQDRIGMGVSLLWRDEDFDELLNHEQHAWLRGLFAFNTLPYQPNVLEGWIIGTESRAMETMDMAVIKSGSLYALEKFLGMQIPEPKNVTISKWFTDPYVRGCYSYHSVETERSNLSNKNLAEAIEIAGMPVIQFAGEATNELHYATVHGAVESGFREAKILKDFYDEKRLKKRREPFQNINIKDRIRF